MTKSLLVKIGIFLAVTAAVFSVAIPLVMNNTDYKGDSKQILDNLNIQATVTENGDMTVKETWQITMENRDKAYRNIYKTIELSPSQFDSLTGVSVYDLDNHITYNLQKVSAPVNAPSNLQNVCYYTQKGNAVEIGLFMPRIYEGTRNFEIQYTFTNCITAYPDTAVLYYQFIGSQFSIPITNMNVTVTLPQNEAVTENPYAWLHCTADSFLTVDSLNQISFTAQNIPAQTRVETRIATPLALFPNVTRTSSSTNLKNIQNEELEWATAYQKNQEHEYMLGVLDITFAVIIIAVAIGLFILTRFLTRRHKVNVPEYTRYVPKGSSPAAAALLYYHYKGGINQKIRGNVFSATLMSLSNKGYLEFGSDENDTLILTPIGNTKNESLTLSEQVMLSLVTTVATETNGSFTLKQFSAYTKKHGKYVNTMFETLFARAKDEIRPYNYYEKSQYFVKIIKYLGIAAIVAGVITFFASSMIYIAIAAILAGIFTCITSTGPNRLSTQGETAYMVWKGLEKYMLEFSNMKEYELPHLELWKDYLVYATMMGISDKVCKQLKLAYPKIDNDDYMTSTFGNTYFYWIFMSHYHHPGFRSENFASGLGNKLASISTAATRIATPPSSGTGRSSGGSGGGGGGFSGGGGGFGGGGGGVR